MYSFAFDVTAILTDSPQNPLYMFQSVGSGKQNRAYIEPKTNYIYEWSIVSNSSIREVRIYRNYDYIDKQWRGVGLILKQYFNPDGSKVDYQ